MKTFDSKWIKIRASDTQLTLELTREGVSRLMNMLVSSTSDIPGERVTRWKHSELFVLASLMGEMEEEVAVSVAGAWIDIANKSLVHEILDELLWGEGMVTLRDRNKLVKGDQI